jgi:hypothetical protein
MKWSNLHERLLRAIENVWKAVRDVLCNDAPEGHVPDDVDEHVNLTTKDVLSYSWRALKEARYYCTFTVVLTSLY